MVEFQLETIMERLWQALGAVKQFGYANASTAIAAFFGTFVGAFLAFFERRDRKRFARDAELAAGRQAQFALVMQLNTMKNMWTQHLEAKQKVENRHVFLRPITVLADYHYPKLPVDRLGYFLELKNDEGPNILGKTMVEEERFFTFVRLLEQRNSRHENMQRFTSRTGPEMLHDAAEQAILKDMTDSLYRLADDVLTHHPASIKTMRDYLKKRFPKCHTLDLEP
jgi:hypothetical protein